MVWYKISEKVEKFDRVNSKAPRVMDKNLWGGPKRPPDLKRVNYSNGKFPYPEEKLYSKFSTPRGVQSGKSLTFSQLGTLMVSLESPTTKILLPKRSYRLIAKVKHHHNFLQN